MSSLQDQLLKAGLTNEKKARKIKQEKRKQAKQRPKGQEATNEARESARAIQAKKSALDRAINQQKNAEAERKAVAAQVRQLIAVNQVSREGGDIPYQFVDGKKIKKLYVSQRYQDQLERGQLAITKNGDDYALVPAVVARKIQERDDQTILVLNTGDSEAIDEDDPYKDFQVPDDLMW